MFDVGDKVKTADGIEARIDIVGRDSMGPYYLVAWSSKQNVVNTYWYRENQLEAV